MMGPNKAPCADGFTAHFYQTHWDEVKPQVCCSVLNFLNGGEMQEEVTKSVIVLIPKVKQPHKLTQFRPLSL